MSAPAARPAVERSYCWELGRMVRLVGRPRRPMRLVAVSRLKGSQTRELARRAFQGGVFLLPHEDPETRQPVDARRWVVVYQELVQFKTDLVSRLEDSAAGFTPEARAEVQGTD